MTVVLSAHSITGTFAEFEKFQIETVATLRFYFMDQNFSKVLFVNVTHSNRSLRRNDVKLNPLVSNTIKSHI